MLVTMEIFFTTDQQSLHFETRWLITLLAVEGGGARGVTWYLHDVSVRAAACARVGDADQRRGGTVCGGGGIWMGGNFFGIGPVIKPPTRWTWPVLGG